MALFRDHGGNLFQIPDEELDQYRLSDEVSEGAALSGSEIPGRRFLSAPGRPGSPALYICWYDDERFPDKRAVGGPAVPALYICWYDDERFPDKRVAEGPPTS